MSTISELYIVIVFEYHTGIVDTGITTTEKKAVDLCLDIIIANKYIDYEAYYNHQSERVHITDILSEDDYIKMLKEQAITIHTLDDLCKYDCGNAYERIWDFNIVKKIVIE